MNKIFLLNLLKSLGISVIIFGIVILIAWGVKALLDSLPVSINPGTVILLFTFIFLWITMYGLIKTSNSKEQKN